MIALLLAAALSLPAEAKPIPVGTAVAWLSVGAAADQWSTGWALDQGATREVNPLGASVEQRAALQLAFIGAGAREQDVRKPVTPAIWKQPEEVRPVTFDFEGTSDANRKLEDGDSIASVVGGVIQVPTGITASVPSIVGNKVTAMVSGGTVDTTYRISCVVTTVQGSTLALDVDVEVLDGAN